MTLIRSGGLPPSCLASKSKSSRKKKSVEFPSSPTKLCRIQKNKSVAVSTKEAESIWYSVKEIETMTHECNELVLEAEARGVTEYGGDSMRGLERKTDDGNTENFLNRVAIYDAVLDAQESKLSAAGIAKAAEKASSEAKFAAFQRAKQDQLDVEYYLHVEGPFLETHKKKTGSKKHKSKEEEEMDLLDVFSQSDGCLSKGLSAFHDSFNSPETFSSTSSTETASTASMSTSASEEDDHEQQSPQSKPSQVVKRQGRVIPRPAASSACRTIPKTCSSGSTTPTGSSSTTTTTTTTTTKQPRTRGIARNTTFKSTLPRKAAAAAASGATPSTTTNTPAKTGPLSRKMNNDKITPSTRTNINSACSVASAPNPTLGTAALPKVPRRNRTIIGSTTPGTTSSSLSALKRTTIQKTTSFGPGSQAQKPSLPGNNSRTAPRKVLPNTPTRRGMVPSPTTSRLSTPSA